MYLKKYVLAGGLSSVLLLSACHSGNEQTDEHNAEASNQSEAEMNQHITDLEVENETLKEQVIDLENDLNDAYETIDTLESEALADNDESDDDNEDSKSANNRTGTRSNPLHLGETVSLDITIHGEDYDDRFDGVIELTVHDIIIGNEAYDMLLAENQFNDPAPDGYEWVLIDATVKLVESETDDFAFYAMDRFEIVESDGSSGPRENAVTPDSLGNEDIYSGGTSSGYSSAVVPVDDDFLIKYENGLSNDIFYKSRDVD